MLLQMEFLMRQQWKYLAKAFVYAPTLPWIYKQGMHLKRTMPDLLPPTDTQGQFGAGNPSFRLLAIGESTMAGIGIASHWDGLVCAAAAYLQAQTGHTVQWSIVAESGKTALETLQQLWPLVPKDEHPNLILIGLGGNDTFQLNSPRRWRQANEQLIDAIQKVFPKVPIVYNTLPPVRDFLIFTPLLKRVMGDLVDLLTSSLSDLCAQKEAVYFPETPFTLPSMRQIIPNGHLLPDTVFFSDGVHPSALTYQTWGQNVGQFILAKGLVGKR